MKTPLVATILILALGALVGWRQQIRYVEQVEARRQLVTRAGELGLAPDAAVDGSGPKLATRHTEPRRVKEIARKLIDLIQSMGADQQAGASMADRQTDSMEVISLVVDLSPAELKQLIEEIRSVPDLKEENLSGIVSFALMMLADERPRAALAFLLESEDLLDGPGMAESVVGGALARLAEEDVEAALNWMKNHPQLVNDRTRKAALRGVAAEEPAEALRLAGELDLKEGLGYMLAEGAVNHEQRTAVLELLRTQDDPELRRDALLRMAMDLGRLGFETSKAWLNDADLSQEEAGELLSGVGLRRSGTEIGQWIEWGFERTEEVAVERIPVLMGKWTRDDFRAAGEWLAELEPGRLRQAAAASYATAVAPYHPQAAAEWIATLPHGRARKNAARQVFSGWKQGNRERDAFARREGLAVERSE